MSTTLITERRVLIDNQGIAKLSATIVESEDGTEKRLYAEGKIGCCDSPTANGRIYPSALMRRELDRLQSRIDESSLYASVDHPGDGKSRIRDTGAIIRGLRVESDGTIWGKFQIIEDTDHGRNLAAILRAGGAVGVSSRGLGSTRPHHESGKEIVGEDFRLVAFDFVLDPAVSTAYPKFFSESDDGAAETVTTDDLRAKFPELIRSIEEQSLSVGSQTTVEAMRIEMEQDVEKAIASSRESLREEFKSELYPVVVKELKEDFAAKLVRATAGIREEVEAVVRSEMAADPQVAGAKLVLEQIASLVVPFNPPVDVKQVIDEKDTSISTLEQSVKALEQKVEQGISEKSEAVEHARNLGFRLYVSERTGDRDDAVAIKEMVGDITQIADVEALQQRVDSAIQTADKALEEAKIRVREEQSTEIKIEQQKARLAQKRADRLKTEDSELRKQVSELAQRLEEGLANKDRTIARLAEQNDQMGQRLDRANQLAEQMGDQAYAGTRLSGHPNRRDIMSRIERGEVRGRKRINQLAEASEWSAEEMGGHERVRNFFGSGREFQPEETRRRREVMTEHNGGRGTPVPNLEGMDISMEEIRTLGSGKRRR